MSYRQSDLLLPANRGDQYEEINTQQVFESVYHTIMDRKEYPKEGSYTNYLFEKRY